jgi:hypothetical protein
MSLLDLALYHLKPWLFAAAVAAPFAVRAWRRLPRALLPDDMAGQVRTNPERRALDALRRSEP